MNDSIFNRLHESVSSLKMKIDTSELAAFADEQSFTPEQLDAICATFDYLKERKHDMMVSTMLRLSKLPLKAPKTFENFDFDYLHGKHVDNLKNLTSLSALYISDEQSTLHGRIGHPSRKVKSMVSLK